MKKAQKGGEGPRVLPVAMVLGLAVVATGWYWQEIQGFYQGALQAAAVFLGL